MREKLSPDGLFSVFGQAYNQKLEKELGGLDQEIEVPKELSRKIEKGSQLHFCRLPELGSVIKIAVLFLVLVSIGTAYVINNPRVVTGLKNYFWELFLKETGQMIDIGVMTSDFRVDLPLAYSLVETKVNRNMTKERYEDISGHYIEVTMFEKGYEMTMDKEQAGYTEETTIAGNKAVIITKNGITTIFLYQNEILFELESNLLLGDFIEAAEHLQIKD